MVEQNISIQRNYLYKKAEKAYKNIDKSMLCDCFPVIIDGKNRNVIILISVFRTSLRGTYIS